MRDQARGRVHAEPAEQGANRVEGADWQDPAELGVEVPPEPPRHGRGRPLIGGRPGERSAPQAPVYGSVWRKQKRVQQQAPAAAEEEEGSDDDTNDDEA
jgi:hypothetical protein